jgi:lysine-N-methylase
MSFPVRNLPVVQNWDCHTCGDCCRRLEGVITDEEKRRLESLDLADDPEVAPKPWFAPAGLGLKKWKLKHRPEGGCVFLTKNNHCRIQEKFGAEVKPFACRLFPFLLIPAGNHWRVGLRFSCPSASANRGRPVSESQNDLVQFSKLLEQHEGRSVDSAPVPVLQAGQKLEWPDLCRVVEVLVEIVQDHQHPLERRLRICLAFARICEQTKFDNLNGARLSKYLQAVRRAVETEVPREPADLPPPDRFLGKVPFRVILAIFARQDSDTTQARRIGSRLKRVIDGWRFARGRGRVPRVNNFLAEGITFDELERTSGPLAELDETLERYYVIKLNSLQFCGPPNSNQPFLAGLDSLVLTLPVILWLRRAFRGQSPVQAVEQAIQVVDDHFGGDPMLGFPHIRYLQQMLAQRGELEKLVAWYSR